MWIAISQRNKKNNYGSYRDFLEHSYTEYLKKFKINLIPIPNSSENILDYFNDLPLSGIILSGGENINLNDKRNKTETELLDVAIKRKISVLGICRGMQFINFYFKGKIIQNINQRIDNSLNHIASTHLINIIDKDVENSLGKKIKVNSYHNQGINTKTLSPYLIPFAKTPDGIIEGIYHPDLPIVGIQWHPERKSPDKEININIIDSFLNKELFWRK